MQHAGRSLTGSSVCFATAAAPIRRYRCSSRSHQNQQHSSRRPAASAATDAVPRRATAAAAGGSGEQYDTQREYAFEDEVPEVPQSDAEQAQRLRMQYERGHCYGCGVRLQQGDQGVAGFVDQERYEVKRKHRQLGQLLCLRCQDLSNGAMIPAVADFSQQQDQQQRQQQQQQDVQQQRPTGFTDKYLLTPEELRDKLKIVQQQRAVVVLLVDLLDASGSILGKVRDLVGNNPIMLIGTKMDLLPSGTNLEAVAEWLLAAAAFKRINAVSVHLVSSKTSVGVPVAVGAIRRERRGRDVFVMGAANVGKSAFIRALVRDMARMSSRQFDPMALNRGRFLPVESAMPGTTLELIPMEVFAAGGMLYDTPGLHLHHRVPHILTPTENKLLHPRRKLRPYVPPSPAELLEVTEASCDMPPRTSSSGGSSSSSGGGVLAAGPSCSVATYWWGGLVKVQVLGCPPDTELVFYGPQAMLVEASVEAAEAPAAAAAPAASAEDGSGCGSEHSNNAAGGNMAAGGMQAAAGAAAGGAAAAAPSPAHQQQQQEQQEQQQEDGEEAQGFGAASVMRRGGLRPTKELSLRCTAEGGGRQPLADIAVSGIPGWIAVHTSGRKGDAVQVRVWTPPGIEVFSRPPLPVPSPLLAADHPWLRPDADKQQQRQQQEQQQAEAQQVKQQQEQQQAEEQRGEGKERQQQQQQLGWAEHGEAEEPTPVVAAAGGAAAVAALRGEEASGATVEQEHPVQQKQQQRGQQQQQQQQRGPAGPAASIEEWW